MKNLLVLLLVFYITKSFCQTKPDSTEILSYYDTIVYYSEFTKSRCDLKKYDKDIKIYMKGENIDFMNEELVRIVSDLNELISSVNVTISKDSNDYNLLVFLGSREEFYKETRNKVRESAVGFFVIFWDIYGIFLSKSFVDTERIKNPQFMKHTLREEITQCMGFTNDTYQYKNSIFYDGFSTVTEFSDLDKEIIKLHYK